MKVVVTGAAGFIGSHLCERLLAAGDTVVGIDSFTDYYSRARKEQNLKASAAHANFEFHEVDLVDADLPRLVRGAEVVHHLAGRPGVRASLGQFDQYVRENITATQRLLEAVKGSGLKRMVYAGSSSVYGDAEVFPTAETALPAPLSPYGVTKLAGEHLAYLYWKNFGVPVVNIRYFSVYGPRMRPDLMLSQTMQAMIEGRPIDVYGDGEQTREFTYVTDAVEGTILAAERGEPGKLYNLGGGTSVTLNQVLAMLSEVSGIEIKKRNVPPQPGDHRRAGASITRARMQLGWEPRIGLREGLTQQWEWFKSTQSKEVPAG